MTRTSRANLALGAVAIAFALVVAVVWVPLDTATGLIETVRRRVSIGDALAPTVAAFFVFVGGGLIMLRERHGPPEHAITLANLKFLAILLGTLAISFAVMRWAGPAVATLATEDGYRPLRDTVPWKYIGFVLGGSALVTGLIAMVEARLSLRAIVIGLLATLAMLAIYDLPFDDLLLPPNGDV